MACSGLFTLLRWADFRTFGFPPLPLPPGTHRRPRSGGDPPTVRLLRLAGSWPFASRAAFGYSSALGAFRWLRESTSELLPCQPRPRGAPSLGRLHTGLPPPLAGGRGAKLLSRACLAFPPLLWVLLGMTRRRDLRAPRIATLSALRFVSFGASRDLAAHPVIPCSRVQPPCRATSRSASRRRLPRS